MFNEIHFIELNRGIGKKKVVREVKKSSESTSSSPSESSLSSTSESSTSESNSSSESRKKRGWLFGQYVDDSKEHLSGYREPAKSASPPSPPQVYSATDLPKTYDLIDVPTQYVEEYEPCK